LVNVFINAPAFRAAVASLQSGSTRKRIFTKEPCKNIISSTSAKEPKIDIVAEIEKQFSAWMKLLKTSSA